MKTHLVELSEDNINFIVWMMTEIEYINDNAPAFEVMFNSAAIQNVYGHLALLKESLKPVFEGAKNDTRQV